MIINQAKWLGKGIEELQLSPNPVFLNFSSQIETYNVENQHIISYLVNPNKVTCVIFKNIIIL
jgi:hypothetical protein